jgi:hypothetical protein
VAGFLKTLTAIFAIVQFLVGLIRRGERVKLEREQEQLADAYRKDMDEIDGDDRTLDDAVSRLRARGVRARTAKRDGGVPKVPGRS